MGKMDTLTKNYMSSSDVFADAFNFFAYNGRQVIDPDSLRSVDTVELSVTYDNDADAPDTAQKQRDLLKSAAYKADGKRTYVLLGIENQEKMHYAMPVKNLIYDAMQYEKQVKETGDKHRRLGDHRGHSAGEYLSRFYAEDRLTPVVTLVVYFGREEWTAPLSLHEMMDENDPEIMALAADYKVNLLQPSKLSDEDFEKFHSTLGTVMKFIQVSGDAERMEELLRSGEVDELPKDAALVLRACTSTDFEIPEETEVVNVCEAIQTMMDNREEKGKQEGKIEGKLLAYYEFVRDGIITLSDGAKRAGQTEAEFKAGMDAYFAQLRELNSDGTGYSG